MVCLSVKIVVYFVVICVKRKESVCKIIEEPEKFTFIRNTSIFIDKTFLLKKVLQHSHVLISAPRKFGKSTNIQMIKLFLGNTNEKSYTADFFRNTNVWRDRQFVSKHMCNYPVIYCSFKPKVQLKTLADITNELQINVKNSFEEHKYLAKSTKIKTAARKQYKEFSQLEVSDFTKGLRVLSEILNSYHKKKVIVLIDDYDHVLIQSIFLKELDLNKVARLVFSLMNETINGNEFVDRAIVMGAVPFKSGLNLVKTFKFLESKDFSPYFGFTQSETEYLLDKFRMGKYKESVSQWYGGYNYVGGTFQIYNPWSVLAFMKTKELQVQWVTQSGEQTLLKCVKPHFRLHQYIKELVKDKNLTFDTIPSFTFKEITKLKHLQSMYSRDKEDYNLFLQLFLESGYLTFAKKYVVEPGSISVKFPNKEIWSVFSEISKQLPTPDFSKRRAAGQPGRVRGRTYQSRTYHGFRKRSFQ